MRILSATLLAVALAALAASCGKSKSNVASPRPGGGADSAEDNATGGATYGGAKSPDDPCGAKSDPCGGDE